MEKKHISLISVFKMIQDLLAPSSSDSKSSKKMTQFQVLMTKLPDTHKAKWFAGAALNTSEQAMQSVLSTALSRLNAFLDSEMEQILCFDTAIDAEKFCNTKSALFLIMPEEDNTKYFLISLIVQQLYARAFDYRGIEYSKKPFKFSNTEAGFATFKEWILDLKERHEKDKVVPGMEPTGHYWFNLGKFLQDNEMKPVLVNPHHVKKTKELDDNNPTKNDRKDPKVIAGLVREGRYMIPYLPEGVYADLRTATNIRFQLQAELTRIQNRISRWFNIYFPEYKTVYGKPDAKSGMLILKAAPLPEDILTLGIDGVNQIWRDAKLRAVGKARAKTLIEAAEHSVGSKEGAVSARMEIRMLLEDYESRNTRLQEVMVLIEELVRKIPMAEKLLEIKGVGIRTVSGFLAEVGDISRFNNPKELQKLAGLALVENSSGKHKGETTISRRGRKRLRYLLFEVAMSLVSKNQEFRELHNYYTTRRLNPLKKMQSLMAIAAKLIRVFYAMLTKGVNYDPKKMVSDIKRPAVYLQAA